MEELETIRLAEEEHDEKQREDKRNEIQWMKKVFRFKILLDQVMVPFSTLEMQFQVLEDQKAEETRRCKMLEHMFSSEAEGFWAKQDKTWREEKAARNKLMDDVVSGWKAQVKEKLVGEDVSIFQNLLLLSESVMLNFFAESRDKSEELSIERNRLEREMEKLNSDIAQEEAKREEQRVRFVEGIKAQVEEKDKLEEEGRAALMSREDFMRQTNEMAQRLQNWDWNSAPELGVRTQNTALWHLLNSLVSTQSCIKLSTVI